MLTRLYKDDFDAVYKIMKESFPADEIRPYEAQKALFDKNGFFVYGVKSEGGELRAFITLWQLNGFTFGEHFAVDKKDRGSGLGGKIIRIAARNTNGRFCFEVEPPETEIAKRRIGFYRRAGFVLNDYEYIQPPLGKSKRSIPLMIMSYKHGLSVQEFETVKEEIYKNVYGMKQ